MKKLLRWFLSDETVEENYVKMGVAFGNVADNSSQYIGNPDFENRFGKLLEDFVDWEGEYSKRGYETVSIADFVNLAQNGIPIKKQLGKKRFLCLRHIEEPKLYARDYREKYLEKARPKK